MTGVLERGDVTPSVTEVREIVEARRPLDLGVDTRVVLAVNVCKAQ